MTNSGLSDVNIRLALPVKPESPQQFPADRLPVFIRNKRECVGCGTVKKKCIEVQKLLRRAAGGAVEKEETSRQLRLH